MHRTRNDIPEDTRRKVIEGLNARLADVIDLSLQTKFAHWNVKGPNFIALHELFDDIAGSLFEFTDMIAERATALGGTAEGTLGAVAKRTTIPAYPTNIVEGRAHVEALATALAAFGKVVRAEIDHATKLGDADTADLFTEISRAVDKHLWFVEAHVQAER